MNAFGRRSRMVWIAVAAACGATLFRPLFGGTVVLVAIAVAAVAALAVEQAVLGRVSALQSVPVHVLALVLVGQAALFTRDSMYGFPTPASLRAFTEGLVDGWSDLLTVALPAPSRDEEPVA